MMQHTSNVDELIKRIPDGYKQACFDTKAIERKREIKSPTDLMKLLLLYLIGGYSTIEISIIALELGIAKISDVAFIKKLAKCREWLSQIISMIIPKAMVEYTTPKSFEGYTIAALDGSNVKEKGRGGRLYRLHYAIDLLRLTSLSFKGASINPVSHDLRGAKIALTQCLHRANRFNIGFIETPLS